MKLEPKAKPVRIRIKSGGEEHFNLESLKRNFSVQDLWKAVTGGSLSRWLRQQNESELAKQVEAFCQIEKPSTEDYIKFSSLFFEKEIDGQSFEDANALVRFYQNKNLTNNFRFAFFYLLDLLDYQKGRVWFDAYRDMYSKEVWLSFFEKQLTHLCDEEEIDCYRFLSKLYESTHDATKVDYCRIKSEELVVRLAKKDKSIVNKWLATGDYFYIRTLFKDKSVCRSISNNDWIAVFEQCKDIIVDQAECFYFLSTLYENKKNVDKSIEYLERSAKLGYREAKNKLISITSSHPEFSEILNHHRNEGKIAYGDLSAINKELKNNIKKDEYFKICFDCIKMFKETIDDKFSDDAVGWDNLVVRRESLFGKYGKPYELLIALVAALAWELKKQSLEFFEEDYFIDTYNNKIYELKRTNKKAIVCASRGMECNLKEDSIIQQMLFCMETFGEAYSVKRQTK